jgi:signal transduction histidine kinase
MAIAFDCTIMPDRALYPLLGLTKVGKRSFYDIGSINLLINFFWVGTICILGVYLYEKLKRSEFESRRQLRSVIYAVSHDLKTPIMGTSVALQGLLLKPEPKFEPKLLVDRAVLEQLLASSNRQVDLINFLQEVQSAEIGRQILDRQPVALNQLVREVAADLGAIAQEHHMTLIHQIDANLPLVNANKTQIWRVLTNLISNALTHNPRDTQITIAAEVICNPNQATSPQSQWIRCTVQDDGIGIPLAQLPHLFELYTRGAKARRMPGLGLGLYLCQQIIVAHQGEMGVNSQPNQGSTFWFTLPIAVSNR